MAAIDRFYHERGYGWLGDHAPLVLFAVNFGGLQLWQWLALLLGLALGLVVARVVGRLLIRVLRRLALRTESEWDDLAVHAMRGPVGLLIWSLFLLAVAPWLSLTPTAQDIVRHICKLLAIAGVGWFLLRFIDASAERTRQSVLPEDQLKVGFLPIVVRFTKAIVVVVVLLGGLDIVGVKVLAVVTALGLGGVAIAFAAQKTLENVFGTVAIAGDRPFKVGDFIVIGDDRGTVEDVGFRSTRIRTLSRTVVSIPNGLVVSGRVENFAERDRFLFNPTLALEYRSTPAQMRAVLDGIRALLAAHPRVLEEDRRVRFVQLAASSLDIEVFAYVACTNIPEFLAVAEELNFALLDVVARAGASFAFPTQTIFLNTEQAPPDPGQHGRRG
ncbi:MAG: mechanosensitive ion channel family protein [Acidobacteria bacterium]|nr:mechanosensitive ion channel family protein [Acidobacteriota bacterium]